jgi:hypothetical protein
VRRKLSFVLLFLLAWLVAALRSPLAAGFGGEEAKVAHAPARELAPKERIELAESLGRHPKVLRFVRRFTGPQRSSFQIHLLRSARYREKLGAILRAEGLPAELLYLCLIESGFSPGSRSPTQTVGLWQFTRRTGARYGLRIDGGLDERKDPVKSTQAAARYLKDLHAALGDWLLAVAAFNAGEGAVRKSLAKPTSRSGILATPLPRADDFVAKFVATLLIARAPAAFGFAAPPQPEPAPDDLRASLLAHRVALRSGSDPGWLRELGFSLSAAPEPDEPTAPERVPVQGGAGADDRARP